MGGEKVLEVYFVVVLSCLMCVCIYIRLCGNTFLSKDNTVSIYLNTDMFPVGD